MNPSRTLDIAKRAGVSTATVDRVLHNRKHVSPATRQRVLQAKAALQTGVQFPERATPWRLKVILPEDAGPSTQYLASCFQAEGARGNATIECAFTRKMEPAALARKLRACAGQGIDAVAFQALDDPRVRDAIIQLAGFGIPSLALLSHLENGPTVGFVGIDNRAAGRTAGLLMGRFCTSPGSVAIMSGGQLYRSHEDREMGFRAILRQQFAPLKLVDTRSGQDDIEGNFNATRALIKDTPDLIGIYNVGGGNQGIVDAMIAADVDQEILLFGHNLTAKTHGYLLEGQMDIVLHQNMRLAAQETVKALVSHLQGGVVAPALLPVEIMTRENTQGAVFA